MERGFENEPYHHCLIYMDLIHVYAGCKVYTTKTSCYVENSLLQGGSIAATGLAIDPLAHAGLSPTVMLIIWWDRRQECQLASLR